MRGDTALFESAQALFCSIADNLGSVKSPKVLNSNEKTGYPTFHDFQKAQQPLINDSLKRVTLDIDVRYVYEFLGGVDPNKKGAVAKPTAKGLSWYKSSIAIANKIVTALHTIDPQFNIKSKGYNDGKMFYYRGDKEVMDGIHQLFKIAKTSSVTTDEVNKLQYGYGFKDINKWNPADIYLANPTAKAAIKAELTRAQAIKKTYTFIGGKIYENKINTYAQKLTKEKDVGLNTFIARLIDTGDLLPLSLKKAGTSVVLKKVNFQQSVKNKLLDSVKYVGKTDWQEYARLHKKKNLSWALYSSKKKKTPARDLTLKIVTDNGEGGIKLRHDPSGPSGGRFVAEFIFKGAAAKGGSIGSHILFSNVWRSVDPKAADAFFKAYEAGARIFKEEKAKISSADKDLLRANKMPTNAKINEYDHYIAIESAENITNKIMPGIRDWFNKKKNPRNQFVMLLFQTATSRDPMSSRFVIAK